MFSFLDTSRIKSLAGPKGYRWALLVAVLVMLPALGLGFFGDDYFFLSSLSDKPLLDPPLEIFHFASGDPEIMLAHMRYGPFPWFAALEAKVRFFRPLSVALMRADHAVFGPFSPAYQAHSILWHLLLAFAAMLVLRRSLPAALGVLALFLFILDDSHFLPAAWWSNRNAVIACSLGFLGLAAHLRWRMEGWRPGLPLSLLGFAGGLLGSEAALGTMAYVLAYEILGAEDAPRKRLLGVLPAALLAMGYLVLYRLTGHGAANSEIYLDPVSDPLGYLAAAPARFFQLAGAQFFSVPAEAGLVHPWLAMAATALGVLSLAAVLGLLAWFWPAMEPNERRALRWMGAGAVLAVLPSLAAIVTARLLLSASLGGAVVLAVLLRHAWRAASENRSRLARAVVLWIVGLHLALAALSWPAQTAGMRILGRGMNRAILGNTLEDVDITEKQVVLVNASDPYAGMYGPIVRQCFGLPRPRSWWSLSFASHDHRLTRTGPATMELEVMGGQMLEGVFERLLCNPEKPLRPGDTRDLRGLVITVLSIGDRGPDRIRLDFAEAPDSGRYLFLTRRGGAFERVTPPALGESVLLPFILF